MYPKFDGGRPRRKQKSQLSGSVCFTSPLFLSIYMHVVEETEMVECRIIIDFRKLLAGGWMPIAMDGPSYYYYYYFII
jgi:hypothetical protein